MWDLAVREADYEAAQTLARRYHGTPPLSMRLLLAFARGDSAQQTALLAEARQAENRQLQIAARYAAVYLGDLGLAEELARRDLEWRRGPQLRVDAQILLGWLQLARGRWSAAQAEFARAAAMEGGTNVWLHRAAGATLPLLVVPRTDLAAIRREVEGWSAPTAGTGPSGLGAALRPQLRVFLLGQLAARLGDEAAAARHAEELGRGGAPPLGQPVVRDLGRTLRAYLAHRRGSPADVLGQLDRMELRVPLELVAVPAFAILREYTHEYARYLRAAALARRGQDAEALRWLRSGFRGAPHEFAYFAPLALLQGEIAARMGDRAQAVAHYERFVKLWEECDPAMRPLVEDVKGRIRLLRGE